MSGVTKKLMSASGGVAGGLETAIEEVFSTYLYTGSGSTQTITNDIDLAGEGGLWVTKRRDAAAAMQWSSSEQPLDRSLESNATTIGVGVSAFSLNSDGYVINTTNLRWNLSGGTYVSWTFRKAPRFFDVVTYTGNGASSQTISHNLGTTVGTLIIKTTGVSDNWRVYHRSTGNQFVLTLNETLAQIGPSAAHWNNTDPTDSQFTVGSNGNISGRTYVAYLFAHDPLGPSGDGSDGLIDCGSVNHVLGTETVVNLGWEPQWILVKKSSSSGLWFLLDNMRGLVSGGSDAFLAAESSSGESTFAIAKPTATGFIVEGAAFTTDTLIYIAIRRGPMRAPESGTEVFDDVIQSGGTTTEITTGFPVDLSILRAGRASANQIYVLDRLREPNYLETTTTNAESSGLSGTFNFKSNTGVNITGLSGDGTIFWNFRRAPEFFDVVAYTGNGTAGHTVPHNLGVAPELIIVKNRSSNIVWVIQANIGAVESYGVFDSGAFNSGSNYAGITAEHIELLSNTSSNGSGSNYIMYLFATLAGVSKVGSYTGNGTSQTINCGFTTGARFILIKRTDSIGDWYVWDTARGIVSGNDPHLSLNSTAAEVTTNDSVDPDSSGFIVNQVAATDVNVNAASYIFYAIA